MDDEIFSNEIPMPKRMRPKGAEQNPAKVEVGPKRKYTRKSQPSPPPIADEIPKDFTDAGIAAINIPEITYSSFGLEYLKALAGLLALIPEAQREKLIEFIIQEKII